MTVNYIFLSEFVSSLYHYAFYVTDTIVIESCTIFMVFFYDNLLLLIGFVFSNKMNIGLVIAYVRIAPLHFH